MIGPRRAALVGRSAEIAALERLLDGARRGAGAMALISGEAGVGKSRLCSEVAARPEAALLLRGQAYRGDATTR